jgi:hypothetical protein
MTGCLLAGDEPVVEERYEAGQKNVSEKVGTFMRGRNSRSPSENSSQVLLNSLETK